MKNIIKYIGLIIIILNLFLIKACTDKFEDYNLNPVGVTDEELEQDFNHIGAYFPTVQQMIYCNYNWGWGINWTFQVMQNLNGDIFSGYMASYSVYGNDLTFMDNRNYALKAAWNDANWDYTYDYLMTNTLKITEKCEKDYEAYAHFDAVNKILKVLAMSRLSDQYGPVIYSNYGKDKVGGTYDSGQDAYKYFIEDLTSAVEVLNDYITKNPGAKPFSKFDMVYAGDYTKWVKFANTLRLRLAMRQVKYDSTLAKSEAEKAIKAPLGIITSNDDNFTISGRGYVNPLYELSEAWGNIHLNANVESILSGYDDPRLSQFGVLPESATTPEIKGLRNGIPNLGSVTYAGLISKINVALDTKPVLMSAAEAYFLLSEAALRGWDAGGSAESFYETGVQLSFDQWRVPVGDYLNSSNLPAAYVDPLQPELNSPAVSTVSPKWGDATNREEQLEKIATQKWIAAFPEGLNAWAEQRRTGYPKLFPNILNYSQGAITTEYGVRRLPFSSREKSGNPEGYADAVTKLGGADNGGTRLFWDINKSNF